MAIAQRAKATPAAPPPPQRVSLNPDDATHGGLIDDIDVTITDAQACLWDYNGQQPEGPALAIEYTDANSVAVTQYYSAGKAEDWAPTEDGTGFVPVSGKTGVNDQTNLIKFMASLADCGFPKETLAEGDVKALIGLKAHVNQIEQERKGLVRTGNRANQPSTVLLVTKIHALPGADAPAATPAKAAKPAAGKPAAKPAAAPAKPAAEKPNGATTAPAGEDMDQEIINALMAKLTEGEAIVKKDIGKTVYAHFLASAELKSLANKAVARANQAKFLEGLAEHGMAYSGTELNLATE